MGPKKTAAKKHAQISMYARPPPTANLAPKTGKVVKKRRGKSDETTDRSDQDLPRSMRSILRFKRFLEESKGDTKSDLKTDSKKKADSKRNGDNVKSTVHQKKKEHDKTISTATRSLTRKVIKRKERKTTQKSKKLEKASLQKLDDDQELGWRGRKIDKVRVGEVVLAPPKLTARPRKSVASNKSRTAKSLILNSSFPVKTEIGEVSDAPQRPPGILDAYMPLLEANSSNSAFNSLSKSSKKQTLTLEPTQPQKQAPTNPGRKTKLKHLPKGQRRLIEEERDAIIAKYRQVKASRDKSARLLQFLAWISIKANFRAP